MKVSICIPSYKRPKVETLEYIKDAKVFVDVSEFDDYVKSNPKGSNIISLKDGIQGNLCRVRNHILRDQFKQGYDAVLIIDDDMKYIGRYEGLKLNRLKGEDVKDFVIKYSNLCKEWGFYFWGLNCNTDKITYREYTPFSTLSYIGGPFQCFLKGGGLYYDLALPLKEDYDMTLQQINKHRGCLRLNAWHYDVKQSKQKGGCATYRNPNREFDQLALLQKKWGKKTVRIDTSSNTDKDKKVLDYNPIIKVPIKGL